MPYSYISQGYLLQVSGAKCMSRMCYCDEKNYKNWQNCSIFSMFRGWKNLVKLVHGICVHNLENYGVKRTLERLFVNLKPYNFKTGDQSGPVLVTWRRKRKQHGKCGIEETIDVYINDEFQTNIWFKLQKLSPLSLQQQTAHGLGKQLVERQLFTLVRRDANIFLGNVFKCPTNELNNLIPVQRNPLLLEHIREAFDLAICQCYERIAISGGVQYAAFVFANMKTSFHWTNHHID